MTLNTVFLLIVCIGIFSTIASAWTRTRKDVRLPGELRVVNEGLSHDDNYWFMSNQHMLYKTEIDPTTIVVSNHHAIPVELGKQRYNHIGDIDVFEGVIYGGMESNDVYEGILGAWNATDLSLIRYQVTPQHKMPWVAVDPSTRLIYSAVWNDCCSLQIYNLDTFAFVGDLKPVNGLPREIQGAAFYEGNLYLSVNGNCSVYQLNMQTNETSFVLSDEYDHHEMEMEGLTFWDLRSRGLGVMHLYGNFETVREKGIHNFEP
jgi:hypothetical protein